MTDEDLLAEINQLRREVDTLMQAVARLIQDQTGHKTMLDTERAFLYGSDSGARYADWPGRPRPDLVPELTHVPPRPVEDTLPRGGRNPRIFCERYDSGTWIHGRPHDCPTWARR